MSQWIKTKLGEIVILNYGKALKAQDRNAGSIPVYSSGGLTGWHNKALINEQGIIIGRKGTVGKAYLTYGPFWCIDTAYYILPNPSKYDFVFLFYLLKTLGLEELNEDSAVPGLNRDTAYSQEILLPSLPEQKAIASVLSSLDDKIDLLHRQNKTLESMAETLFRQWFDVDSNDEWQEKNVLDIFTLVGGGTPKTSVAEYWTDEIPWISGGDISAAHQGYLYSTEKSISLAGLQNSSAKLLPKNSTVISARGTVGKYALLARDMAFSQSNYGIVSKIGSYPFFIYLLVGFIVDDLLTAAYGSVFDTITTRTFESVNLKFPSLNSIEKFNEEISPIFSKKETNTQQIKTLENLRDTLLPKLMSGEVRVQYAEEAIASVA
ncbi:MULTISPECIES: restriction endonuclease subunit S [Enterobacteriaceae]|uniref:restriction endonuclease subunit S n=1 Tax=Enterobacteriaceae TaxID=543 RepID=UPI000735DC7A|nr:MULTISPECIES: restriction endonuclease subunit S [Enterobacteriaceae]KTH72057.1 restriction endonuclease subunit S [Enterobacter roggenkampii]MCW8354100.1 restriction endonuclease subunit S [Citrobacter portucalensis]HEG2050895.1 restriction endonuclease subunit S [Enterobacter kobei]